MASRVKNERKPDTHLRVLGAIYDVYFADDDEMRANDLADAVGATKLHAREIWLRKTRDMDSTMLHEAIECLVGMLAIRISHPDLCRLETGILAILRDNKMRFDR